LIAEYPGLDQNDVWNVGCYEFHLEGLFQ
jgi:hypothetical protein